MFALGPMALAAVFVSGILFLILTYLGFQVGSTRSRTRSATALSWSS